MHVACRLVINQLVLSLPVMLNRLRFRSLGASVLLILLTLSSVPAHAQMNDTPCPGCQALQDGGGFRLTSFQMNRMIQSAWEDSHRDLANTVVAAISEHIGDNLKLTTDRVWTYATPIGNPRASLLSARTLACEATFEPRIMSPADTSANPSEVTAGILSVTVMVRPLFSGVGLHNIAIASVSASETVDAPNAEILQAIVARLTNELLMKPSSLIAHR